MKRLASIALMTVATALAVPSAAQNMSSNRYGSQASQASALSAVRQTGRCFAINKEPLVRAILATKPGSAEEAEAFGKIFNRRELTCIRNASYLQVERPLMRGAMAEALYRRSAEKAMRLQPIDPSTYTSRVKQGTLPAPKTYMAAFTDCVAASRPTEAHAIVSTTKMGSPEEKAAMRGLVSTFSACLPNGQEIELIPLTVRIALAESLYSLDLHAQQAAIVPAAANGTK